MHFLLSPLPDLFTFSVGRVFGELRLRAHGSMSNPEPSPPPEDRQLEDARLLRLFPADLRVATWNRELVQKGMSEMGREALTDAKRKMGAEHRTDIISFADMIDLDEGRLP